MANDIEIDGDLGAQLFTDETAEEAVARIVAQNPEKHGVTLEQRKARARAAIARMLAAGADLSNLSAEDALIVAVGGNPNEMMVGNKPRYTVDEAGNVKDHETGEVHRVATADESGNTETDAATLESQREGSIGTGANSESSASDNSGDVPTESSIGPSKAADQHPSRDQSDDQAAEKSAYLEARVELTIEMLRAIRAICAHSWPEDPQESTPCAKCGMTFEDWANL